MSVSVRIVSEVPRGRTEGSERLITDVADVLTGTGEAEMLQVTLGTRERWTAPLREILRGTPKLLHYFPIGALTVGALLRGRMWRAVAGGPPVLFHAFQTPRGGIPPARIVRRLLGSRALVVTPSSHLEEGLRQRRVPVVRIPPAVDLSVFRLPSPAERLAARREFGLADGDFVVLHAGHLTPDRNLSVLAELAGAGCKAVLVLSPRFVPPPAAVSALASAGVRLVTGRQPLERWYWAADCYLFPVVHAAAAVGLPLSVIEALSCGVPCVSTRFDGLYAELGEEWPGMRWADPPSLIDAVMAQRSGRQVASTLIGSAAQERFGLSQVVGRFRACYETLMRGDGA